jgi:hypothetical protein
LTPPPAVETGTSAGYTTFDTLSELKVYDESNPARYLSCK